MFEELDQAFGGSDKIDPALLLSSGIDFTSLSDCLNTDTSQSLEAASDSESPMAKRESSTSHRNGRTHNSRKCSKPNTDALTQVFTKKWKEDKELQKEREQKEEERAERAERRQDEMLNVLKGAVDALTRIADAT